MTPIVNKRHFAFVVFAILAGILVGTAGYSFLQEKRQATEVIVTVFSILAGFLIAIITLLGDQSMLPGSWRIAESKRTSLRTKLIQQKYLFYLYLITLSIIFISTLLGNHSPTATEVLERVYFGFATTAFILSFRLPSLLMEVQMDRIDAVIGARRGSSSRLDKS